MNQKMKIFLVVALAIIVLLLILRLLIGIGRNKISEENPIRQLPLKERTIVCFDDSKAIVLTSENYTQEVKDYKGTVVIEFVATWAEECKEQDKIISQLSLEMQDVKFARVDKDAEKELSEYFGIDKIPTLVIMQDGVVKSQMVGIVPKDKIKDLINY